MGFYASIRPWYDRLFPVGEAQAEYLDAALAGAGRVLDFGCGTGRHLARLAREDRTLVGVEPEPAMAAAAREHLAGAAGDARVVAGGAEAIAALPDACCDAALCLGNTLAHLTGRGELDAALGELRRLLAPGGDLITQTVNFDRVLAAGRADFPVIRIDDPDHGELVFTRDYDLSGAPARVGFRLRLRGEGVDVDETFPLLPLTRAKQEARLARFGFALREASGDWTGAPATAASPALILRAGRLEGR